MQNTNSLPCCNRAPRTVELELFGKTVRCKGYVCSADGLNYADKPEPVKLQLTIVPTNYCPCTCPFCSAAGQMNRDTIDLSVLETRLRQLKEMEIVRGVSFSGGEPFWDIKLLDEALAQVFEILGKGIEVSINTNGIGLSRMQELRYLSYLDTIHISRHHYDDEKNDRIFGMKMLGSAELREAVRSVPYRDLFVFNCLLMKDYIGSPDEARRFMDYAIDIGVPKVSFVTGIPVNDFVRAQTMDFESVLRRDDPSLLFTRGYRDYSYCRCRDGVYVSPGGALEEFYGRATNRTGCDYAYGLVYGADNHIRAGFAGGVII